MVDTRRVWDIHIESGQGAQQIVLRNIKQAVAVGILQFEFEPSVVDVGSEDTDVMVVVCGSAGVDKSEADETAAGGGSILDDLDIVLPLASSADRLQENADDVAPCVVVGDGIDSVLSRGCVVVDISVGACSTCEHLAVAAVAAFAAFERVVARAAIQRVSSLSAVEFVLVAVAVEFVLVVSAVEFVVACAAVEFVVVVAASKPVVVPLAFEDVVALESEQVVVVRRSRKCVDRVVSQLSVEVVACRYSVLDLEGSDGERAVVFDDDRSLVAAIVVKTDREFVVSARECEGEVCLPFCVVASGISEDEVACSAVDFVERVGAEAVVEDIDVVALAALEDVVSLSSFQGVCALAALEGVVFVVAREDVCARAADDVAYVFDVDALDDVVVAVCDLGFLRASLREVEGHLFVRIDEVFERDGIRVACLSCHRSGDSRLDHERLVGIVGACSLDIDLL